MNTVTWSEIEAECEGFRAGFVATFRKYEGMPTDEKDKYGRPVTVTVSSFARHAGIPRQTFERWEKGTKQSINSETRATMDANMARTKARALPPEEKAKLATELLAELPEQRVEVAAAVLKSTTPKEREQVAELADLAPIHTQEEMAPFVEAVKEAAPAVIGIPPGDQIRKIVARIRDFVIGNPDYAQQLKDELTLVWMELDVEGKVTRR